MVLVFLPIGDEVARLPQEWFLNTPVLWLGALVLIGLVRGPLRNAPGLLKKPLRFAAASCIALGAVILLMWDPVLHTAKQNKPLADALTTRKSVPRYPFPHRPKYPATKP